MKTLNLVDLDKSDIKYQIQKFPDGGATFINIAKSIKEQISDYKGKIYLIVTHGIFSKGFEELGKYFNGIYCTNSYKDKNNFTEGFDYHEYPKEKTKNNKLDFVKQLNVF